MGERKTDVLMSDILNSEDSLEHYGVKGMKWGVRKDRNTGLIKPGSVLRRAPLQRRDDLMKATATKSLHTRATFQDQSGQLKKIYKSARPKIKAGLKKLNADPKYSGVNLNEKSNKKLREAYNKDVSRVVTDQLNAASYVKTKRKDQFAFSFEYRSGVSKKPIVAIAINDKKMFLDANRKWAKETRKSVKHSEDDSVVKFELVLDKNGFVTDLVELTSMAHFDDLSSVLMSDLEEDSLSHYGVKGMKWGVRKDRRGKVKSVLKKTPFRGENEYDGPNADGKSYLIKAYADPKVLTNLKKIYKDAYTPIKRGLKSINKSDKYKKADLTDPKSKIFKQYHEDVSSMVREKLDVSTTLKLRPGDRFVVDSYDYDTRSTPTPRLGTVSDRAAARNTPEAKDYADGVKYRHNTEMNNITDAVKQDALKYVIGNILVGRALSTPVIFAGSSAIKAEERSAKNKEYNEFYKKNKLRHSVVEDEKVSDPHDFYLNFGFASNGFIEDIKLEVKPKSDVNGEVKHFDLSPELVSSEVLDDYLAHYGVKGMRWGVRRSRSAKAKERSEKGITKKRTNSEKERIKKAKRKAKTDIKIAKINAKKEAAIREEQAKVRASSTKKPRPASQMTNAELQEAINRHNLEVNYNKIIESQKPKTTGEMFRSYAASKGKKAGDQAVDKLLKTVVNKAMTNYLGLEEEDKKKKKKEND